ncbi:MAG: methyltransferase regulatory domain-containing protein [Solirubrobacteraceae bacterium]
MPAPAHGGALAYEAVDYPGYAYPATHPARLQVLGRLFGLTPASAGHARVLELGCGDGVNALAIAQSLPYARVVGIDAAPGPIGRGAALAREATLDNVQLRVTDLADVDELETLGPFDYIIAHGVYSWISPRLRGSLLECCQRCLAPHGIAFVSYNAYPGSYLRDMARDILEFHLHGITEPTDRIAHARDLMEAITSIETPSPYALVLRQHLQRMLGTSDALLYHDDLAPVSTPFYFHEFIEHADAHGLQFLSEAELSDSQLRDVPQRVAALMHTVGDDVVIREQYLDFFRNRMFRQTLLVHASAPVRRAIDDSLVGEMHIASSAHVEGDRFVSPGGASLTTADPWVSAAMHELIDRWPANMPFDDLARSCAARLAPEPVSPDREGRLHEALLEAYLGQVVQLYGCALPVAACSSSHPVASPLPRVQARAGLPALSTLIGGNCVLEHELDRRLLGLLDGTRDADALSCELDIGADVVDQTLARLARAGLLISSERSGARGAHQ